MARRKDLKLSNREDEIKAAQSAHKDAALKLARCPGGKSGFGAEADYGATYQRLVRAGAAPQIRGKYRA